MRGRPAAPRRWWSTLGVPLRSAIAASLLLGLLVVGGAAGGIVVLRALLIDGAQDSAAAQARLIRLDVTRGLLQAGPGGGDETDRAALERTVGADDSRGSLVQVVDEDDRVLVASGDAAGLPPLTSQRPGVAEIVHEQAALAVLGGDDYLVTVVGASSEGEPFWVVVAQPRESIDANTTTAVRLVAIGTPLLLLAVAVATWVFVGRSLRPVEAIRRTVEGIGAAQLDGRVPVPPARDEVARLAQTMNAMLARLEASQAAQRRFIADASHELRSPVATLRAAVEIWDAHPGTSSPREFAGLVGSESSRLERLVDDLLLLARADEGALAAGRTDVDLDEVVEGELARLRATTDLTVTTAVDPVRVRGDYGQLLRMVRNLVDNAARYARSSVSLGVRTETVGDGVWAVVEVTDDGPGVPEGERVRVFDRFVRLQEGRDRGSGGTGLGLAIVAELVAAHGGFVQVGQAPGGGASFRVRLPADRSQPPSSASR